MADLCPCSPIGGRRSRRACRGCNKNQCGTGCPGRPIIRERAQGIVMSGAGAPPNTACEPAPPCSPRVCFLYVNYFDFQNNVFYKLRKSATGQAIGYDMLTCGEQILNLYRLTTPDNIAAQGVVIASGTVLNMVDCLVPRANDAIASSSINRDALAYSIANANAAQAVARMVKCIASANMGIMGFVFGNPPTPRVIAGIRAGQGFTTTPTIVLTPREFGFVVYVRDSRTGLYFRDPNNSPLTDPNFPANPCNGDIHDQPEFNLRFQFNADTCKWYLASFICEMAIGCDAINQGLQASGFCEIAPNWREKCACVEKEPACEESEEEFEIVERIVEIKRCKDKKHKKACDCESSNNSGHGEHDEESGVAATTTSLSGASQPFSLVSSGGGSSTGNGSGSNGSGSVDSSSSVSSRRQSSNDSD